METYLIASTVLDGVLVQGRSSVCGLRSFAGTWTAPPARAVVRRRVGMVGMCIFFCRKLGLLGW